MNNKLDFGQIDARSIPFIKKKMCILNDGELPVQLILNRSDGIPFAMRQNKRSKNFQSHEARFDDYIICVSYNKSYLLPGEKMNYRFLCM